MSEHQWFPVDAVQDHSSALQFTYRNELGEEHIHVIDDFYDYWNPRSGCWSGCSGDWPGCRMICPAFAQIANEMQSERHKYEKMPKYDPFSFMLHHTKDIDDTNCYVEEFDTLDGVHWEISVDIEQRILEGLDMEDEEVP